MDAQAAAQEGEIAVSYTVKLFDGDKLPENYVGMVYSRWMRSYRYGNDYIKMSDSDSYYQAYQNHIKAILSRPGTIVRIAVLSDDHDVALGFCITRENILDYVHVHKDFRRISIATQLIPRHIDTITHVTRTGLSIWGNKYSHWKLNLFA